MVMYQIIITAVLAMLLLNTVNNLRLLRASGTLSHQEENEEEPLVSILVPARNEARSIAACVESLAQQSYPQCEILVLDDQSEDQTAAIVAQLANRYPNIRLLHGRTLPPYWHGKAYACAQLAQAASGEWLLFVDADTALAPQCVSIALRQAQVQRADLLTMMPTLLARSFGEALLMPIIALTFVAFLPLGLVTNHSSPLFAGALGPFLLFRRDTYLRIGGHAAVSTDIVEDMQLSRLVKRHGGRVVWIDGTAIMRVRMYHGFAEAWRGIAKSAFAAINYSRSALLIGGIACAALFWGPYLFLAERLIIHPAPSLLLWLPLIQVLFLGASYLLLLRRFHLPLALVFFQAGTILAIVLTTFYSAVQTNFGAGVVWKGRTYRFDVLRQRDTRTRWAAGLLIARLFIAALLLWSGGVGAQLQVAEALLLLGWTVTLFEHMARKSALNRRSIWGDLAGGFAYLGYLQLSGLLSIWLTLSFILLTALCVRWFSWQIAALMAMVLPGSILLIATEMHAPNKILLGWFIVIALVASRSVAQLAIPWLQRFRSSR